MSTLENAPVHEGEILDGKYRVDRVVGVGGMGVVVAATHVQLQTQVAIKFLLPEVLSSQHIVERFVREARAAVRIQSEHVARVSDVGTLDNGAPYMVMEYLEGQDLADVLAKSGPLSVAQAVSYLLQACEAIAEAHALGIVHRDLKPANLFLARRTRREPIIKVLDFGISKMADADSLGLTKTSALMGSPYYMSPEQMKSARDAEPRSDIWALGITLYELLAGVPPFQGETVTEVVVLVTQGHVPPIRESRPDVPVGIADVIERCLQRDPRQRFSDIAEFAKALVPFGPPRSDVVLENIARILGTALTGRPAAPDAAQTDAVGHAPPAQATAAAWSHSRSESRSNLRGPLLIGIAVALVAAVTVLAWRFSAKPSPTAAAALPASATIAPPVAVSPTLSISVAPATVISAAVERSSSPLALAPASESAASPGAASVAPIRKAMRAVPVSRPAKAAPPATPPPANRGLNMGMKE